MQAVREIPTAPSAPATFKVATPTRHIDSLRPHPDNPRDDIDPEDPTIIEMAHSIVRHGIIEPLVITPDGMVIAGHRRRVASRVAATLSGRPDLMIVPVTVRDIQPEAALELMLQENMQRKSLTPLEEARAMYAIMERKKLIVSELAREVSVPAGTVTARLAILKCEPEVQKLFGDEELAPGAAIWLAQCDLRDKQINYAGLLARRQMSLEQLKTILRDESYKQRHKKPEKLVGSGSTIDGIPKPRPTGTAAAQHVESGATPLPSREDAMNALVQGMKRGKRSVTLFNFKSVVESICCACGMTGQADVCKTCPFPRIILAVAGRAD